MHGRCKACGHSMVVLAVSFSLGRLPLHEAVGGGLCRGGGRLVLMQDDVDAPAASTSSSSEVKHRGEG